jgi:diguanylate cyclase (GGDEF)-like protein
MNGRRPRDTFETGAIEPNLSRTPSKSLDNWSVFAPYDAVGAYAHLFPLPVFRSIRKMRVKEGGEALQSQRSKVAGLSNGVGIQSRRGALCEQILNSMEQGVMLWSSEGKCLYVNERMHTVLEYGASEFNIGMSRAEFIAIAVQRGESSLQWAEQLKTMAGKSESIKYDRHLPSGRIVATTARRLEDGSAVVTFTDVTAARKMMTELEAAKKAAEDAETRTMATLAFEQRRQRQMHNLSLLSEWLQSCKSLPELYRVFSAHMANLLPRTSGELYIYSNSRDVLDGECAWNGASVLGHINPDDCWALRRGRPYAFGTSEVEFACEHLQEQDWPATGRGYFCIPIVAHGDTIGLLHIKLAHDHASSCGDEFESLPAMRTFAIQCAEQISLAVANVKLRDQLHDQSIRDPLTGLYNRRYLLEAMRREINRAMKSGKPLSLISLDADHFKRFNDNHGHDAGDVVLRTLGETMRRIFDGDEVCSRFGGEEFTILITGADKQTAVQRAEELRAAAEELVIRYGDQNLPRITLSLGVATYPQDGTDAQLLLAAADAALYRAKAGGRNMVRE